MSKKKIIVIGSRGKMGLQVAQTLKNNYLIIEVDKDDKMPKFEADLVIDFASAESSVKSAELAARIGVPLIIGSTGQTQEQFAQIEKLCKRLPRLVCANFSVGFVLLKKIIDSILKVKIDEIAIFEKHHKNKKDAPSGTAKELQRYILEKQSKMVQMLSLRGGKEIGSHKISFYFGEELIEISHAAFSRQAFVEGVLIAVEFMLEQKNAKKYNFESIIEEKLGLK